MGVMVRMALPSGLLYWKVPGQSMAWQPPTQKTIAFFDGQNLHKASKTLWGYRQVNYDPRKLAELVCHKHGWQLAETRFYTGIPRQIHPKNGNTDARRAFWDKKIHNMESNGVYVFTRELRYSEENGTWFEQEKGIDVRIALDVVMSIVLNRCEVALIFSQDQDLSEISNEIRSLSKRLSRWIKIASAFPYDESATGVNTRGIDRTDWCRISRAEYDSCIDTNHYR